MRNTRIGLSTALLLAAASPAFAQGEGMEQAPPPASPSGEAPMTPPPASPAPMGMAGAGGAASTFGAAGTTVVTGDAQFNILHNSYSMGGGSGTTFHILLAADRFFIPNFSLGVAIGYDRSSGSASVGSTSVSSTSWSIPVGARVGYVIPLTGDLSLWPRAGALFAYTSSDFSGTSTSGHTLAVEAFVPVLCRPVAHFFVGLGPVFETQVLASMGGHDIAKETSYGVMSEVGGDW